MKILSANNHWSNFDIKTVKPLWFLVIGTILMTLSHLTLNVDFAIWISMVPFLLYLHFTKGWKSRLVFSLFLALAWCLIVSKIVTEPIPFIFTFLYAIPITLIHLGGYLLYDKVKTHKLAVLVFPALMITLEWVQYTFTPLASWGIAAYSQVDSANISQSVSLFGMAGLGFLIYWINAALVDVLINKKAYLVNFYAPFSFIILFSVYGHVRLDFSRTQGKQTIKVAAVGTDSEIGGMPLPTFESNVKVIKKVFERTTKAAALGAKIVVWNEASFYLPKKQEQTWLDSMSNLAAKNQIALTAAYVVPISLKPFKYENKYVLFGPDGTIKNTYHKHQPVPVEPAIQGKEAIVSTSIFGANIGGAICYDYDFPYLAKKNSQAQVDVLCLPASDWRGIDPIHTQMASFRAIEQGHAIIRSTRSGLSAIINPHGEMKAQMSSFDSNDKILVANVSKNKVFTLYSVIGDVLVYLSIVFIVIFFTSFFLNKKQPNAEVQKSNTDLLVLEDELV